jgi:hypothetical protein
VAVRRKTIKLQVEPALREVMEPDDEIMAGMLAMAGLSPLTEIMVSLPVIVFTFAGIGAGRDILGIWITLLGSWLTLAITLRRRSVFVAVTQRQLICCRLAKFGNEPVRPLFCTPLTAVRITGTGRRTLSWKSVRYIGPGAKDRGMQFHVYRSWLKDLAEVLTALETGGAAVETSGAIPHLPMAPVVPEAMP